MNHQEKQYHEMQYGAREGAPYTEVDPKEQFLDVFLAQYPDHDRADVLRIMEESDMMTAWDIEAKDQVARILTSLLARKQESLVQDANEEIDEVQSDVKEQSPEPEEEVDVVPDEEEPDEELPQTEEVPAETELQDMESPEVEQVVQESPEPIEPEPVVVELTPQEKLEEEGKTLDLLSEESKDMIMSWAEQVKASDEYRNIFNRSQILRKIITNLLANPDKMIPCQSEVVNLFHEILQGNKDYHEWLFNQLRKLAEYISKTSLPGVAFQEFLTSQAYKIVEAQKKEGDSQKEVVPKTHHSKPTESIKCDTDEKMREFCETADSLFENMWNCYYELQVKDAQLSSMNPTSNKNFTERYHLVRSHLSDQCGKTQQEIRENMHQLDQINQRWAEFNRATKSRVTPIEHQLQKLAAHKRETEHNIAQLELQLQHCKEVLENNSKKEEELRSEIVSIRTKYAPESTDLNRIRADIQFKLHGVYRKNNCYTHLNHIADESYKHLDSWSKHKINLEKDSRNLLLHQYYDQVRQYTAQQVKILDFLTRRRRFLSSQLEKKQQEAVTLENFYGPQGTQEHHQTIQKHRMRMNEDTKAIEFLQREIQRTVQKAFSAAEGPAGVPRDNKPFYDLYTILMTRTNEFKIDLSSLVKLPQMPPQPQTNAMTQMMHPEQHAASKAAQKNQPPQLDGARNQPLQIISDTTKLSLANQPHHGQGYQMATASAQMVVPQERTHAQAHQPPTEPTQTGPRPSKPPVTSSMPRAAPEEHDVQNAHAERRVAPKPQLPGGMAMAQQQARMQAHPQAAVHQQRVARKAMQATGQKAWSSMARTNGVPRGRGRGFARNPPIL